MKIVTALALLCIAGASVGCCSARAPNIEEFRHASLEEQIHSLQRANECDAVRDFRGGYLDILAEHGVPAAEAVSPFLNADRKSFPVHDALLVVRFVQYRHDLRGTAVIPALKRLAEARGSNQEDARSVLKMIEERKE